MGAIRSAIPDEEHIGWIVRFFDDSLDHARHDQLERWLLDDPGAADCLAAVACQIQAMRGSLGREIAVLTARLDTADPETAEDDAAEEPQLAGGGRWERWWSQTYDWLAQPMSLSLIIAALVTTIIPLSLALWTIPQFRPVDSSLPPSSQAYVAQLVAVHKAKWAGKAWEMPADGEAIDLRKDSPVELVEGMAEIRFDSGAVVVLEGPVRFACTGKNQLQLDRGQLTAQVPSRAAGFTVATAAARIVDVGTEFGVSVGNDGRGVVEVFEGQIEITSKAGADNRWATTLAAGQAATFSPQGTLANTDSGTIRFKRQIAGRERSKIVSLTQAFYDKAGRPFGVNVATGKVAYAEAGTYSSHTHDYRPVAASAWIDGVFIPHGPRGEPRQVTSTGITTDAIPFSSGFTYDHLWSRPNWQVTDNKLDGVDFSHPGQAMLGMHTNKGITFDLDAIRRAYPGWEIGSFQALAGNTAGNVSFTVLIDGKLVREVLEHEGSSRGMPLVAEIQPQDRFLTLVTTEAARQTDSDWAIIARPKLTLRLADGKE